VATCAEHVSPGLWAAIEAIPVCHFDESRIKARTADISATSALAAEVRRGGISYIVDEVDQVMAELGSLPPDALAKRLRRHRPGAGPPPLIPVRSTI
jgi:hypothetical protein